MIKIATLKHAVDHVTFAHPAAVKLAAHKMDPPPLTPSQIDARKIDVPNDDFTQAQLGAVLLIPLQPALVSGESVHQFLDL
jgi:hypothetical protein